METILPQTIKFIPAAKEFLSELHKNGETYHPEDDAHDIVWGMPIDTQPTRKECDQLNNLMDEINILEGFDACEYLLNLDSEYSMG